MYRNTVDEFFYHEFCKSPNFCLDTFYYEVNIVRWVTCLLFVPNSLANNPSATDNLKMKSLLVFVRHQ